MTRFPNASNSIVVTKFTGSKPTRDFLISLDEGYGNYFLAESFRIGPRLVKGLPRAFNRLRPSDFKSKSTRGNCDETFAPC